MGPTGGRSNSCRFLLLVAVALAGSADLAAAQQGTGPGPSYFDPKNPSLAIVIVVLVTAFFFLGFFSIYIRRCTGGPLGGPGEYSGAGRPAVGMTFAPGATRSRRVRGVDPAVLEAFPTMAYADVKAHKAGKGALECAVCLSEFDDDEMLRLLPRCSHAFHADCIDAWLASHVTCPVCRASLVPDDEAPPPQPEQVNPATEPPGQESSVAAPPEQVAVVTVDAEEAEEERTRRVEAAELMRIGSVKRALRNKSGRRPAQFPRSHTTGHSLAGAGESSERYTLRLPESVLTELAATGKLRRTTSLQALRAAGDGSTRRGFVGGSAARSVRLGQSGRWPNMSFLARTFSAWGSAWRGDTDPPAKAAKVAGDGKAAEQQCDSGGACPLPLGRV